jgi:hypothetical protein
MILDYEMELTAAGGQLFNAADGLSEYGAKPYDLKATAPGDPAHGEPLDVFAQVDDANSDVGTSLDIALVNDTDGAGGSEITTGMPSITVPRAALLVGTPHRVGRVSPGLCTKRYLTPKVTTHGDPATVGKLKIWLQKAADGVPANAGFPTA